MPIARHSRGRARWRGPDVCLDVVDVGNGASTPVLAPCRDAPGQMWISIPDASGAVRLTTMFGGAALCLDLVDGTNRLAFARCGARPGQLWHLVQSGSTTRLSNAAGGPDRCLDVINDGTNNPLQLVACGNYSGQLWTVGVR